MAALIKDALGIDSEVVEGGRGEFTVWVGDQVVAKKDTQGFPSDEEALAAVKQAMTHG
ncbi:MAG TPA: hypothetical protein VGJ39_17330 [Vicinamibacterales bacterium]